MTRHGWKRPDLSVAEAAAAHMTADIQHPYPWERECGHAGKAQAVGEPQTERFDGLGCAVRSGVGDDLGWDFAPLADCPGYIPDPDRAAAVMEVLEAAKELLYKRGVMLNTEGTMRRFTQDDSFWEPVYTALAHLNEGSE